jgi:hypothetical protein
VQTRTSTRSSTPAKSYSARTRRKGGLLPQRAGMFPERGHRVASPLVVYELVEVLSAAAVEREPEASAGVPGMSLRLEVRVLSWSPDRGNPSLMRQGRGPELTGRLAGGWGCCWWVSVRACLEEAVGVLWLRTRVKRRKAVFGG